MQLTRLLSERRWVRRATSSPCEGDVFLLCEDGLCLLCEDGEPILLLTCEAACPVLLCQDGVPLLCEDGTQILLAVCAPTEVTTHTAYAEPMIGEADLIGDLFVNVPHNRLRGRGRFAAIGAIHRKQVVELKGFGRFHNPITAKVNWVAGAQVQGKATLKALQGAHSVGAAALLAKGKLVAKGATLAVPTARFLGRGTLAVQDATVDDIGIIMPGVASLVVGEISHQQTYKAKLWSVGETSTLTANPVSFTLMTGAATLVGEGTLIFAPPMIVVLVGAATLSVATAFHQGRADLDAYGDLFAMGALFDPNATRPVPDGYLYPVDDADVDAYETIDCSEYGNGVFPDFNEDYDGDFYDAASDG
ncbi:hypothetical protein [Azospirillum cavernae]|uniref:hypothetical protein n=1 Tax=Azospirillum cavernae TaxID=2320860 RepID=UPI0011C4653E|nr:hypothetical protein [Azospirillum cavernae]